MIRRYGLAAIASLVMCSAAASGQDIPAKTAGPAADANLYVIRTHVMPVYKFVLKVDGQVVTSLTNGHYTALHLAPGKHHLSATFILFGMDGGGMDTDVDIKESGATYLEYNSTTKPTSYGFERTRYLFELDVATADSEIAACCKFKAPAGKD